MANEIQELKFQVGEAWKGVYSSSTAYGLANVVQDPTGLSIYRSLKSGNVGHPLSNASWWFRIIDLSSIKAESDRIAALNQSIAQDEVLRVAAEELRQQHEAERVAAETQRDEAEQARISAEQQRVNKESQREAAEQQRISAEQGRVSAESARVQAEQARVLAETLRANAEDQRAANEQNRVAAEQQRIERAEQDHQRAESDHATYVDSLGAFDISSYHATDGVLAKYADLTAALGTGGANIPDDLRKGGMSVKFVQSSDNKYVQYRYMGTSTAAADFTNIANWQGVDDEPIAGSNNLVKSGGTLKKSASLTFGKAESFGYHANSNNGALSPSKANIIDGICFKLPSLDIDNVKTPIKVEGVAADDNFGGFLICYSDFPSADSYIGNATINTTTKLVTPVTGAKYAILNYNPVKTDIDNIIISLSYNTTSLKNSLKSYSENLVLPTNNSVINAQIKSLYIDTSEFTGEPSDIYIRLIGKFTSSDVDIYRIQLASLSGSFGPTNLDFSTNNKAIKGRVRLGSGYVTLYALVEWSALTPALTANLNAHVFDTNELPELLCFNLDSSPTENSKNAVESGGIYNSLQNYMPKEQHVVVKDVEYTKSISSTEHFFTDEKYPAGTKFKVEVSSSAGLIIGVMSTANNTPDNIGTFVQYDRVLNQTQYSYEGITSMKGYIDVTFNGSVGANIDYTLEVLTDIQGQIDTLNENVSLLKEKTDNIVVFTTNEDVNSHLKKLYIDLKEFTGQQDDIYLRILASLNDENRIQLASKTNAFTPTNFIFSKTQGSSVIQRENTWGQGYITVYAVVDWGDYNSGVTNVELTKYAFDNSYSDFPNNGTVIINAIGDSLTAAGKYITELKDILGFSTDIRNYGVGGEGVGTILGRINSIPMKVGADFELPSATTPVSISLKNDYGSWLLPILSVTTTTDVIINGIEGTLAATKVGENATYTFTRKESGSQESVKEDSVILFKPAQQNRVGGIQSNTYQIIWAGQNGGYKNGGETARYQPFAPNITQEDANNLCNMLDCHVQVTRPVKYLVLSAPGNTSSILESTLSKHYGGVYLNVRKMMVDYGIETALKYGYLVGEYPTEQDETDIANGKVPTSLRYAVDNVHFNDAGYKTLAQFIKLYINNVWNLQ
jgi:lysophospholipase L1-like esterase